MEISQILKELECLDDGFPREALEAAIAQREAITPHLLALFEDPYRLLGELAIKVDWMLPFYALYLLAQFREQRAYAPIVAFFSIPGDAPTDYTGDFVTEDLGRVLASVSGGDVAPMKRLIEDPEVGEYVSGAGLDGLVTLMVEGALPRDALIEYLRELLHLEVVRGAPFRCANVIAIATDIYPEELMPEIREAYARDLVEEDYIDLPCVEQVLGEGKDATLGGLRRWNHYKYVGDTISEIGWWACFQPEPTPVVPPPPVDPEVPEPKVGRNDPCPCGSGRKYKHCCGRPATAK